jgi:hypothetical protein
MADTPRPAGLDPAGLVATITYKPGWAFRLGGPGNRYLCVQATTPDSTQPERARTTQHMFELPQIDDPRSFYRWAFDQLLLAELHEAGEFFTVSGHRPYFPHHQDEGSPYELVERWETT